MTRSKRTPAGKPATRSVSKSCHAAGFTLRYRQFHYPKLIDSSTGFKLPNGANRSPDASWVSRKRLEALNPDPARFLPIAPNFAVELPLLQTA
ncbi:Uma2 family endonuclease [Nostoc sp.]|uniref:Uma2 family endonuclease n=1 Tax=Nostoc sp. TaxID=1180 RepID=UPI003FA60994